MPKGGKTIAHILPFVLRPMLPPSDPLFPPLELEIDELVVVGGRVLVGLAALVAEAACKKKSRQCDAQTAGRKLCRLCQGYRETGRSRDTDRYIRETAR